MQYAKHIFKKNETRFADITSSGQCALTYTLVQAQVHAKSINGKHIHKGFTKNKM